MPEVATLHLTEITPKTIAIHNPKEVAGFVDMIETVLEIKDTHVREVMTPLVDVVATDASATLVDFHHPWVTHQYSRVPVFEQRVENIVGITGYIINDLNEDPEESWLYCNESRGSI
ncbi:hypothetical protein SLEP1_g51694 [Rubroshorea leprosula]|uniref:Uncharacterized protein n=1 Tax=Rubroshorea leprosula TaxID=152421 RepID=A0AAV5M4S3_9ROSI|nr:hypothetical protein SLEP1_g51694 [Rubroshorea leprosula]